MMVTIRGFNRYIGVTLVVYHFLSVSSQACKYIYCHCTHLVPTAAEMCSWSVVVKTHQECRVIIPNWSCLNIKGTRPHETNMFLLYV